MTLLIYDPIPVFPTENFLIPRSYQYSKRVRCRLLPICVLGTSDTCLGNFKIEYNEWTSIKSKTNFTATLPKLSNAAGVLRVSLCYLKTTATIRVLLFQLVIDCINFD